MTKKKDDDSTSSRGWSDYNPQYLPLPSPQPALAQLMGAYPTGPYPSRNEDPRAKLLEAMQRDRRAGGPLQSLMMDETQWTGDRVRPGIFDAQQDAALRDSGVGFNFPSLKGIGEGLIMPLMFMGIGRKPHQ